MGALSAAAEYLLALVTAEITAAGVVVPKVSYVNPGGLVAADGEQLVVALAQMNEGQPGIPGGGFIPAPMQFRYVEFHVLLLRKVAALSGNVQGKNSIPSSAAMNASGVQILDDGMALWTAGQNIKAKQELTGALNQPVMVGPMTAYGPEGGLAGSQLTIAWTFT